MRIRLIVTVFILYLLGIAAQILFQFILVLPAFDRIDQENISQNAERLYDAFYREKEYLETFTEDWAYWDSSVEFVEHPSAEFIKSDLNIDSFYTSRLDFIAYINNQGNIVWNGLLDEENEQLVDINSGDTVYSQLKQTYPEIFGKKELSGFISWDGRPFMFANRKITTSEGERRQHGSLVMGKFLDKDIYNAISGILHIDFFSVPADTVSENASFSVSKTNDKKLRAQILINDINNNHLLVLRFEEQRKIYNSGMKTLFAWMTFFTLSGLIITVFLSILITRLVIAPVLAISRFASGVLEQWDLHLRFQYSRNDEVKPLSDALNLLLATVELQTITLERDNLDLEQQSMTDSLTKLPNKRSFEAYLDKEIKSAITGGHPISILMLDVDYFKDFNDIYGHVAGDECLSKLGQVLKNSISRPPDFFGRFGGEEFVGLLPSTDMQGAEIVAKRITDNIKKLSIPHSKSETGYLTVSIGICSRIPDKLSEAKDIIKAADENLYKAKKASRNKTVS